MNLPDSLQKIRNFELDAGPFLEVFDQNRDLILQCAQTDLPQEAKEHLAFMVAELDRERANFVEVFNSGMADIKSELGRSCDTIADQMMQQEKHLIEIKELVKQVDDTPIPPDDAKHNPFHPANLVASVPSLASSFPITKEIQFSEGAALVKTALTLKSAKDLDKDLELEARYRHQRTSGNIWENWKMPGQ